MQTLRGHTDPVLSAITLADNERVAAIATDGGLLLWSLASGEQLLAAHPFGDVTLQRALILPAGPLIATTHESIFIADINALEKAPISIKQAALVDIGSDGRRVLSMSQDGRIDSWSLVEGDDQHLLDIESEHVVAFTVAQPSPNVAQQAAEATVPEIAGFEQLHADDTDYLESFESETALKTPDGRRVIGLSGRGDVQLWDGATGRLLGKLSAEGNPTSIAPTAVPLLPVGEVDGGAEAVEVEAVPDKPLSKRRSKKKKKMEQSAPNTNRAVEAEAIDAIVEQVPETASTSEPQSEVLASPSEDETPAELLHVTAEFVETPAVEEDGITVIEATTNIVSPSDTDERQLEEAAQLPEAQLVTVEVDQDEIAYVHHAWKLGAISEGQLHDNEVRGIRQTPLGTFLSASTDGKLLKWSLLHREADQEAESEPDLSSWELFDDSWVSGHTSGVVVLHSLSAADESLQFEGHQAAITALTVDITDAQIVSGAENGELIVWRLTEDEIMRQLEGHQRSVSAIASNASFIASADNGGLVTLWDNQSGARMHDIQAADDWIHALVIRAETEWLVAASDDKIIRIFSINDGSLVATYAGHLGWVRAMALSESGELLLSADYSGVVCLWDLNAHQLMLRHQLEDALTSCYIAKDGSLLVGSVEGVITSIKLDKAD